MDSYMRVQMRNMNNFAAMQIARKKNIKRQKVKKAGRFDGFLISMFMCLLAAVEFIIFFVIPV